MAEQIRLPAAKPRMARMTALRPVTNLEVSCRNDAAAGVGDRVCVLEWADPRRVTQGRATVPVGQTAHHLVRLAGPNGLVAVRVVGEGAVVRVIQWLRLGGPSGLSLPARVVVRLDGAS
jgi:hypothetical protein